MTYLGGREYRVQSRLQITSQLALFVLSISLNSAKRLKQESNLPVYFLDFFLWKFLSLFYVC